MRWYGLFLTRELEYFFFVAQTLGYMTKTLGYMKNTLNQIISFPPPKSEYFFQQHWESEYFFLEKKPYHNHTQLSILIYLVAINNLCFNTRKY